MIIRSVVSTAAAATVAAVDTVPVPYGVAETDEGAVFSKVVVALEPEAIPLDL